MPYFDYSDTPFFSGAKEEEFSSWSFAGELSSQVNTSFFRIAPSGKSLQHNHMETECIVIIRGSGTLHVENDLKPVTVGDVIQVSPLTEHFIQNQSSTEPLLYASLWWEEKSPDADNDHQAPLLVTSTPPTPNGRLHLGHLSGPYIAADMFARYARLCGRNVRHISGIDDHQSYVGLKAVQESNTPKVIADFYGSTIRKIFSQFKVAHDHVLDPQLDQSYQVFVRSFFKDLFEKKKIVALRRNQPYSERAERYVTEGYIRGICPHCQAECDGNSCERCGIPNQCLDMHKPQCRLTGEVPGRRQLEQLYIPLESFRDFLQKYWSSLKLSKRAQDYLSNLCKNALPDYPITQKTSWGISLGIQGYEDQRIGAWPEMAAAYLYGGNWDSEVGRVHHFYGFDNIFYHLVLFPALIHAYDPQINLKTNHVINELYQLEGKKFSTSRNHAVWADDFLETHSVDEVRYYLLYDRPETSETSFCYEEFQKETEQFFHQLSFLVSRVSDLLQKTDSKFPQQLTKWDDELKAEAKKIQLSIAKCHKLYTASQFSPRSIINHIKSLMVELQGYTDGISSQSLPMQGSTALILAALRSCALLLAPIIPGFADRLWQQLGYSESIDNYHHGSELRCVPAHHLLTLNNQKGSYVTSKQ